MLHSPNLSQTISYFAQNGGVESLPSPFSSRKRTDQNCPIVEILHFRSKLSCWWQRFKTPKTVVVVPLGGWTTHKSANRCCSSNIQLATAAAIGPLQSGSRSFRGGANLRLLFQPIVFATNHQQQQQQPDCE